MTCKWRVYIPGGPTKAAFFTAKIKKTALRKEEVGIVVEIE